MRRKRGNRKLVCPGCRRKLEEAHDCREHGNSDGGAVRELAGLLKTVMADRGKPETDAVKTTLINWALEQTAKDREQNSPAALANLITALKDVLPAQAKESRGAEKSEMLAVIAALKDMQPKPQDPIAVLERAKGLFTPAGESERSNDQIEQLDKVLGFAQKLAALRVGGGERNGWDTALDFAKEMPAIVSPILQFITNTVALRNGVTPPLAAHGMVPSMATAPPVSFDPYRNPELMRQFARSMNAQTGTTPPAASPAGTAPSVPPDPASQAPPGSELAALVQQYGGLVVSHLNMGTTGWGFADYLVGLLGAGTHAQICAQGEPALAQALLAVPEIAMFGEARLKKWVHEFVNFEEFLDKEEEEGEEAAAAAGKG